MIKGQNQTKILFNRVCSSEAKCFQASMASQPTLSNQTCASNLICLPTHVKFTPTWQSVNVSAFIPVRSAFRFTCFESFAFPRSNFKTSMKAFILLEFDVLFRFSLVMSGKMYKKQHKHVFQLK